MFLNIAGRQLGKGSAAALGFLVGRRIAALGDGEHCFSGQLAGVTQSDRPGIAVVQPTRTTVATIDRHPTLAAGRLYPERQATLMRIPNEIGSIVRLALRTNSSVSLRLLASALAAGLVCTICPPCCRLSLG